MEFFTQGVDVLKTLVIAIGAGLGGWGVINLMEEYGNDNPGAKSQGIKQLMAGGGIVLIGLKLIPLLSNVFN
ncbi:conjugal transfer protein [Clostridium perfringens]|nr:conjugal transfer protein [Clostridium perfringens]